jgi:DNA primase catalytic core
MARIPDSEIERLKMEVSVERLVEASGIELKKTGKDLTGCCPFHEDDTASLVVTPAKNLWHCFGCGIGGGPIDWVIKKNGVSFRHAVELLREGVSSLAADPGSVKRTTVRALPPPVAFDADDHALLNQVADYYHDTLKQSPEALEYLKARGLASTEAVEHFKLGYADRTLGLRLPQKNRVAGAEIRTRLQKIGIYRESGHEHFNGSLIVPVCDEGGNVVEVYGRKIRDDLRKGTPKHLYLSEACRAGSRGVFNVAALAASKEIILCEALIDALTFWCAGYRNVTSSYGIEGFTDDMLEAFKRYGTERVLIAYDRDDAGERGTAKVAEQLMAAGIACYRIQFPKGMDANEYALKVTPAAKSLGVVIRKAEWLGQGAAPSRPESLPMVADTPEIEPPAVDVPPVAAQEELPPLPASPQPAALAQPQPEVKDNEINLAFGEGSQARRYRVRGVNKNLAVDTLKINLLVAMGDAFHVDTLDLYAARQRAAYIAQAALETGLDDRVLKTDLGRVLLALEQLQDEQIQKTLHPEPEQEAMNEAERQAALELLKAPDLLARILADFDACGLVGEATNKLVGYLAAISRLLSGPLAVVVQSTSAAGKSSLMDAVLAFVPEEERIKYSAMTGQSLFYMGEANLKHKILAIAEEEGASRASYALKLLQSDGELTMASTGKDPVTGNLITQAYRVEGPVMIFLTTTAIEIDEELLNRCIVLSVDEGREQTEAIHQLQRRKRTLQGLQAKQEKERVLELHRNAQRLLRPLAVVNPYADRLTFRSDQTRTRRDHEKYLTLIDTIALLHQHQRPIKTLPGQGANGAPLEYIEATLDDIAAANALAHDVLGRSLDELPPQTRRLLAAVVVLVNAQCEARQIRRTDFRFSRKEVRKATGWGDTQLRLHLERLTQMEYLLAHREGSGGRYVYELVYDGDAIEAMHLSGLLDPAALQAATTTAKSRGEAPEVAGRLRGDSAPVAAPLRVAGTAPEPATARVAEETGQATGKTHLQRVNGKVLSYPQPVAAGG